MDLYDEADAAMAEPDEREIAEWCLAQCARAGSPPDAIETLAAMLHVDSPDPWSNHAN